MAAKMKGVQEKEVTLSLNKGYVDIPLAPGNSFDLWALPGKVREHGFSVGDMEISARGKIVSWQGKKALEVSGRKDMTFLLDAEKKSESFPAFPETNEPVEVIGTLHPFKRSGEKLQQALSTLWVKSLREIKPAPP